MNKAFGLKREKKRDGEIKSIYVWYNYYVTYVHIILYIFKYYINVFRY